MMRLIALCLVGFACVQAATVPPTAAPMTTRGHHHGHHTHAHNNGTGPTKEPSEHENFKFAYQPTSHHMILANGHDCYIVVLSDAERTAVHTDTGIRALEIKLLGLISSGTLTVVAKDTLDKKTIHSCGRVQGSYYNLS